MRLDPATTLALCIAYTNGDRAAGDALLREYDALCVATARRYKRDREDMTQACRLGLLLAATTFDPGKGAAFATHAVWRMRHEMRDTRLLLRTVRLPCWADEALNLATRMGVKPQAMADAGIVGERSVLAGLYLRSARSTDESSHSRIGNGKHSTGARTTLGDRMASDGPTTEEQYDDAEQLAELRALISTLTNREQIVIARRMDGETLETIGGFLDLTRERVRQIEAIAMEKMRAAARKRRTEYERRTETRKAA